MNKKRALGIFLIFLSIIIFSANLRFTGAVVGATLTSFISIFALGFFVVGILLALQSRDLELIAEEGIALPSEAVIKIETKHPGKKAIILDTSYVGCYTKRGAEELMRDLSKYGEVIAPDSVLQELETKKKFRHLKPVVEQYAAGPLEGFESYRKLAGAYLGKTEKAQMYQTLHPILEAIFAGERKVESLTEKELKMINEKSNRLQVLAENDKFNMIGRGIEGLYKTKEYLETHCDVSGADTDVVASAFAEARYNNIPVVIAGKDIDFEQAVSFMQKPTRRENWKMISYETPYKEKR